MLKGYVLTLTGSAQRLSTVLDDPSPGGQEDRPLKVITLQPLGTNLNAVYVSGASNIDADNAAIELPPGDANSLPPGPFQVESTDAPVRLSQVWVLGTVGEKVRVGAWHL